MDRLTWIKSSYSGGSGGNCVEVAILPDGGRRSGTPRTLMAR